MSTRNMGLGGYAIWMGMTALLYVGVRLLDAWLPWHHESALWFALMALTMHYRDGDDARLTRIEQALNIEPEAQK